MIRKTMVTADRVRLVSKTKENHHLTAMCIDQADRPHDMHGQGMCIQDYRSLMMWFEKP
jgi:hypothetical protein